MHDRRFYDQALIAIERGWTKGAYPLLAGKLFSDHADQARWQASRHELQNHPIYEILQQDPYTARACQKPRGYAGDAELIDLAYDRLPPEGTSPRAVEMFACSMEFPATEAVRQRRDYAEKRLLRAWSQGKRICVLACGHLREADMLMGKDAGNIVAVDLDPLSLAVVRSKHGAGIVTEEANAIQYLRNLARSGGTFDYIYTLGLTDYFDDRAMSLLHRLMRVCLAPGGEIMVANFLPGHFAVGWMDAVMDWHLIYRDEADMARFAGEIGMKAHVFRDPTGSIVFCEMKG